MGDKDFHDKVDKMFESKLKRHVVRIKDLGNDKILTEDDVNYDLVLFDSDLNIYKLIGGEFKRIDNSNFKALLI